MNTKFHCLEYSFIAYIGTIHNLSSMGMKFEKLKKKFQPTYPYRRNRVMQGETKIFLRVPICMKYVSPAIFNQTFL